MILKIIGKINRVSAVAVTNPPITTIANGFEDSEPMPVETAAGSRPIAARAAVMVTGLIRAITPDLIALSKCIRS